MNYEFKCNACGHIFEKNMKMDEKKQFMETQPCPNCGEIGQLASYFSKAPGRLAEQLKPNIDFQKRVLEPMANAFPGSTIRDSKFYRYESREY